MVLGIRPTVDIIFKAIFGDEKHADLTRSFINDILAEIGRPLATTLEIISPIRPGHFSEDKDIVFDVRAIDKDMAYKQFRDFAKLQGQGRRP